MRVLILCVDRDNDIGSKLKVSTPIIGREKVASVANAYAMHDPEDSDVNALFSALAEYERAKEEGEDAEIAVICGDVRLGKAADAVLVQQLEQVLETVRPESTWLVSDGAEDEYIYPVLASRTRVDRVKRVFIKQVSDIEQMVHTIFKTLGEEKVQRKVYIPLALAFLVYGVFALTGYQSAGWGAIAVALGVYFLVRAYNLESTVMSIYKDIKTSLITSGVSMPFTAIAIIFIFGGFIVGWSAWNANPNTNVVVRSTLAAKSLIWWVVFGVLLYVIGSVLDHYIKERVFAWSIVGITFSLFAMGWITTGALALIRMIFQYSRTNLVDPVLLQITFIDFVFGTSLVIIGAYLHKYIKSRVEPAVEETEGALRDLHGP